MNEAMQPTGLQGKSVSETQKPYVGKAYAAQSPASVMRHSQSGGAFRDRRMYNSRFSTAVSAIPTYIRFETTGGISFRRRIPASPATRSSEGSRESAAR